MKDDTKKRNRDEDSHLDTGSIPLRDVHRDPQLDKIRDELLKPKKIPQEKLPLSARVNEVN